MDKVEEQLASVCEKLKRKTEYLSSTADEALHEGFTRYINAQKATIQDAEKVAGEVVASTETLAKSRLEKALAKAKEELNKAFLEEGVRL